MKSKLNRDYGGHQQILRGDIFRRWSSVTV